MADSDSFLNETEFTMFAEIYRAAQNGQSSLTPDQVLQMATARGYDSGQIMDGLYGQPAACGIGACTNPALPGERLCADCKVAVYGQPHPEDVAAASMFAEAMDQ